MKSITIDFDKKLYSLSAVKAAIEAYKDWADFSFDNKAKEIKVTINKPDKEVADVIADELANYALALMKACE